MLAKRIIPCLDVDKGRVVKGVRFFDHVDAGDPLEQARFYDAEMADELVFYDITASHEGRGIMTDVVRAVADEIFMPITVGGGVRTVEDATALIQAGAEKISVNSAAVKNPRLINDISRKFGRCATVVGIDANRVAGADGAEKWEVFINGGRVGTGRDVLPWAIECQERGAGEIVLNVMNSDGTLRGYDIEMTRAVSTGVEIPVVASGGAGTPEHLRAVLVEGSADAALAASIFHFRTCSVKDVKTYLHDNGVNVRL